MKAEKAGGLPLTHPLVNSRQVSQIPGHLFVLLPAKLDISSHTLPAKVTKYIHEPL